MAKKGLLSEQGNITAIIILMLAIGSAATYYLTATDEVDKEIRGLSATQNLSYLKADMENSISRWLEAKPNSGCPASQKDVLHSRFTTFNLSPTGSSWSQSQSTGTNITFTSIKATEHYLWCYLHPNRYSNFSIEDFTISFTRGGSPNYQTLTNEIAAKTSFTLKYADTRTGNVNRVRQNFNFGFRMEAATLGNFGLIFTDATKKSFTGSSDNTVTVAGKTLVLGAPTVGNLTEFSTKRVTYTNEVHMSSSVMVIDTGSKLYVEEYGLDKAFKRGIIANAIPAGVFPLGYATSTAWSEAFNYEKRDLALITLPFTTSRKSSNSGQFADQLLDGSFVGESDSRLSDTKSVFNRYKGDQRFVSKTCEITMADEAGNSKLMAWSNMNTTFTIDLSLNSTTGFPPVFCGMIAARKIIVKMNNATDGFRKHYLIGKFFVKDGIEMQGTGDLTIIDATSFQGEDVVLPAGSMVINAGKINEHIYSQAYLTYRNFFLPILNTSSDYATLPFDLNWIKPMSISEWAFTLPCSSYYCYQKPAGVPEPVIDVSGTTYPLIDQALPKIYFMARSVL